MGMHVGLVVAETPVEKLKEAFLAQCPQLELVETKTDFTHVDELWQWKDANEVFVSAADWSHENPGKSVYVFWQDKNWAMMLDPEYVFASDESLLSELSNEFGQALSFIVESAGGVACFWCYQNGTLRRQISYHDGEMEFAGEPLPQEEGIDVNNYYMDETEALWRAFGLRPHESLNSRQCVAISVIDRSDYSS